MSAKVDLIGGLWSRSFFLLWQGQLVSTLGDAVYKVALSYWILKETDSTTLMGFLLACGTAPKIFLGPFAGVFADRHDRVKLIALMDFLRGVSVLVITWLAFTDNLKVWMVFVDAVLLGVFGALFNPAAQALLPDIVSKKNVVRGQSLFGVVRTAGETFGQPLGAFLSGVFQFSFLFLANGLSYIFSAVTELFIRPVYRHKPLKQEGFWQEVKDGVGFVWRYRGMRWLVAITMVQNFLTNMIMVLILPLLERESDRIDCGLCVDLYNQMGLDLADGGSEYYFATVMAFFLGGVLVGMIFNAQVEVPRGYRYYMYMVSVAGLSFSFFMAILGVWSFFVASLALLFVGGFFSAIIIIINLSSIHIIVPQDLRGKVFSLHSMLTDGVVPFGFVLGGVLGDFLDIWVVMQVVLVLLVLAHFPLIGYDVFKKTLNYDEDKDSLKAIL